MRRLAPFLLAAIMASFPPSLLLVFISGLASTAGPSSPCTHHGVCGGGGIGDVVVAGFGSTSGSVVGGSSSGVATTATSGGKSSGKSSFVTGVAHAAYVSRPPSHHPMVAATTAATMAYYSGGKKKHYVVQPVSAEGWVERTPPRQLSPHSGGGGHLSPSSPGGGEKTVAEAPPDTLKVSVLGASRGKSSSCTYSLVEFSNTHHADTITVHSTYIEPTAVFPPNWANNDTPSSAYRSNDQPPSSSHGEYYQDARQLHIPPRTAVTVPVSIIPHWRKPPDLGQDYHHLHYRKLDEAMPDSMPPSEDNLSFPNSQGGGTNNETTNNSNAMGADLVDMLSKSRDIFIDPITSRSQLFEEGSIHETLVAHTSWGSVQMKVPYVCSPSNSKEYEFGLPNNLMFLDGGGGWYARRNTTPTVELAYLFGDWKYNPTRDNLDPFIYRVYMNNPTERGLQILAVYTTKPWLVGVEVQLRFNFEAQHRMNASHYYPLKGRTHPPKKNNLYIATLRLFPEQFTVDMLSSIQDLGFLEVKTSAGSFSIALDILPNAGRGGVIHGIGENRTTLEDVHLVRDHVMNGLLSKIGSSGDLKQQPPMTILKSYRAMDNPTLDKDYVSTAAIQSQDKASSSSNTTNTTTLLKVFPERINFGSITTGSRTIRIFAKLVNQHSKPLRVMRISVAMSTVSDSGDGNITDISMESHRMEIGVDVFLDGSQMTVLNGDDNNADNNNINNHDSKGSGNSTTSTTSKKETFVFPHDLVLPSSPEFEFPIQVWCRFHASPEETILPRFYKGTILIQATEDRKISYRDWEKQVLLKQSSSPSRGGSSSQLLLPYVLEIPFEGSVLPGNLGSPTESLLFPTHFFVLPVEERVKIMQRTNGKVPEYYDRELDITNNFAVPISIISMRILDSSTGDDEFCLSRFSTPSFNNNKEGRGYNTPTAERGEKWKGLSVRYHFHDDDHPGVQVRRCILSLETDRAGKQSLPLIIYSGEIVVDMERPVGVPGQPLTVHCLVTKDGKTRVSRSGMPCMMDWMENTPEGVILEKAILKQLETDAGRTGYSGRKASSRRTKKCSHVHEAPVNSYFENLLSSSPKGFNAGESPYYALQPIVLSFGAIAARESMSRSILLTNMNHVPIDILATTAAVGNMDVRIGTISADLNTAFPLPETVNDDLHSTAFFLHHSPMAKDFFSKFKHKFDIGPSPHAQGTELLPLFNRHHIAEVFQNETEYLASNYIGDEEEDMNCAVGFTLSTDGTYEAVIDTRKVGKKKWTLPPGGVARFVVTVKAPAKSELENDVTPFVGTGLVLETNLGQALPIVLTYSVISGQLQLKPSDDFNESDVDDEKGHAAISESDASLTTVQVPMTFKDPTITPSVDSFAQRLGVSLSIESTFLQDLYLNELRSCNKWFNVFLPSSNSAARDFFSKKGFNNFLRIQGRNASSSNSLEEQSLPTILPLGKVLSALSCSHPSSDTSFFACALAWLENRDQIQAPGCGISEVDTVPMKSFTTNGESLESRINEAKKNAIGALRDVVAFLSVRYVDESAGKAGAENKEGYIHFSRIHMFQHARTAWKEIVSLGLNTITGHLDAKTVYFGDSNKTQKSIESNSNQLASTFTNENHDRRQPPLSIPVSTVLLQSTLEIPKLFWGDRDENSVGVAEFGTIHVADTATRFVPILNPTAMTIRVRLAALESVDGSFGNDAFSKKNVFVQNAPTDHHSWWTGGSYWMSDDQGSLISASHNVTIKSGAGAYVSLLNPALHTMSAFVLGCGKRCGLRNEQDSNGEEKNYSPIGSASGDGSKLLGRSYDDKSNSQQSEQKTPQKALGITDPPSFSLGRVANEIVIPPYGTAELGPVYFRPPGRGDYEGTIYIENSLTGFEEVKVHGRGGWENLVFLDQQNPLGDGGDVEFRFGQSALVFPGSQPEPGPVVKSVRLANHGDIPVDISRVYMASSEVMHYTHKRRHPSKSSGRDSHSKKCSARGFVLPGCVDSFTSVWIETLFSWCNSIYEFFVEKLALSKPERTRKDALAEQAEKFYKKGFTLQPNQTQTIYVLHYPDCTFQTSYASVIFEIGGRSHEASRNRIGSWQQTFRQQKVELLVGYDMSASQFRHCVPYMPPETTVWERKMEFQFPSLIQDILSFGLTRFKDANGDPYLPRRPIEVSFVAASFILLLFALSLDLLFTVEITANRKSCPSWKPTCRCLARADPPSSDLVSIGKEQTKHVLLSRFKKEGALPSHCVHSDGSFRRENAGSNGGGTHSEAIFDRLNLVNESKMNEDDGDETFGLLPCGLGWRTALRRGIGLPPSPKSDALGNSPELQYLTRTRDRYLKKQRERKSAVKVANTTTRPSASVTFAPSVQTKSNSTTTNGHSTAAKPTKTASVAPLPQVRQVEPQVKKNPVNGRNKLAPNIPQPQPKLATNAVATKGNTNTKSSISDRTGKNDKIKNAESGKPKNQQKVTTGGISYVAQTDQKSKFVDTKVKQKQRIEAKSTKNDRSNRTETKKDTSKQDESSSKPGKSAASQKARSVKESTSSGSSSKGKPGDKALEGRATSGSPSSKELIVTQTKQARQNKKTTNGTKNAEQPKGKQGKQKPTSKKTTSKNSPKSLVATAKSTTKQTQPNTEFPPLSTTAPTPAPQAATPNRSKQANHKVNVRPPPGLLAPPGFLDQPDLEGISVPSSPASSPQRSSSQPSPTMQPMPPGGIAGMDIMSSPLPLNNDLLSLIGSDGQPLESSLFNDNSPRSGNDSALSIPQFQPQSFTPPILEPSPTTETNGGEAPDVQALLGALGAGSNFNVSNFLDGILSESTQQQPPIRNEVVQEPVKVAESIPFQANTLGVSLDPWNNSDNSTDPLAALQGAVNHQESSVIAGIPLDNNAPSLLATSTIQNNANTTYAEPAYASLIVSDEGGEDSDFLEPDSFYNHLLGED